MLVRDPPKQGQLLPTLGLFTTTLLIIGSMIGSGIFRLPSTMMQKVQDPTLLILVWIIGGIFTIAGALTFAELAGMFPRAGGQYVYLRESMGKKWAFLYGWSFFWVVQTGIIAAVAVVFAEFTQRLFGASMTDAWIPVIAVGVILVLSLVNYVGVRLGGLVNNVFTVSKFVALLALIVLGFAIGDQTVDTPVTTETKAVVGPLLLVAMVLAMLQGFFALDGWPQAAYVAPEVKNPTRNVPRAMFMGVAIVTVIYILATGVYVFLLTESEIIHIAELKGVIAAEAAKTFSGENGAKLISAAVMVSTFGTVNAYILTSPRIFYAVAEDGLFPSVLRRLNPRFNTPTFAIIGVGFWAGILVMVGTFSEDAYTAIVEAVVFGIWLFYIPTIIGYFRLRKRRPDAPRPYRTHFYPVTPIVFLAASVITVGTLLFTNVYSVVTGNDVLFGTPLKAEDYFGLSGIWGSLLILTGVPFILYWRHREKVGKSSPAAPAHLGEGQAD